jgi:hypothetical protein
MVRASIIILLFFLLLLAYTWFVVFYSSMIITRSYCITYTVTRKSRLSQESTTDLEYTYSRQRDFLNSPPLRYNFLDINRILVVSIIVIHYLNPTKLPTYTTLVVNHIYTITK